MLAILALPTLLATLASSTPTVHKRAPGLYLHSTAAPSLCLGLPEGTVPTDGTRLSIVACSIQGSSWEIQKGDNQVVRLAGTNFCMDAGSPPSDRAPAKLWTCLPGVPQQRWYYTDDNHLAITGGTVCMERVGAECNRAWCGPGTKTCSSTTDQVWTSSVAGDDGPQEPATGTQIHPNYVQGKCVTVTGTAANGAAVNVQNCVNNNKSQLWDINRGSGQVKLTGTNFCLDAGSNPADGTGMKIWTCYGGLFQQTWYYTDDNHIAITGGTQCLDLRKEDGSSLQTWTCSGANSQQIFTL